MHVVIDFPDINANTVHGEIDKVLREWKIPKPEDITMCLYLNLGVFETGTLERAYFHAHWCGIKDKFMDDHTVTRLYMTYIDKNS